MRRLPGKERRGRPDILHFTVLEVLGSPLNRAGKLETYIHTQSGSLIEVNPSVRLPRNYDRFKSLFEKLLLEKVIRSDEGTILLQVVENGLQTLRARFPKGKVILLSEKGPKLDPQPLSSLAQTCTPLIFIVGCFPHGDFSEEVKSIADAEARLADFTLDAWVAASRILCLLESTLT